MATKTKGRVAPRIEEDELHENFVEQLATGLASDAMADGLAMASLQSLRGQAVRIERCLLRGVTLVDPKAQGLEMRDVRIDRSDLPNVDLTRVLLDRVEIVSTRLTGTTYIEAQLKSVLFQDCKMDFALLRMARLQTCVFERCILTDADFYSADLTGAIFRDCDLSRTDLSHARLAGADLRGCRLDGLRGTPDSMEGLLISPDQAALLIGLFGVKVVW